VAFGKNGGECPNVAPCRYKSFLVKNGAEPQTSDAAVLALNPLLHCPRSHGVHLRDWKNPSVLPCCLGGTVSFPLRLLCHGEREGRSTPGSNSKLPEMGGALHLHPQALPSEPQFRNAVDTVPSSRFRWRYYRHDRNVLSRTKYEHMSFLYAGNHVIDS
jgi:hypothetical protein